MSRSVITITLANHTTQDQLSRSDPPSGREVQAHHPRPAESRWQDMLHLSGRGVPDWLDVRPSLVMVGNLSDNLTEVKYRTSVQYQINHHVLQTGPHEFELRLRNTTYTIEAPATTTVWMPSSTVLLMRSWQPPLFVPSQPQYLAATIGATRGSPFWRL
jgi:hypothetical protein